MIPVGQLFGTKIQVHWTFGILVGIFLLGGEGVTEGLIRLGIFVGSLLCHEYGHILVARRYGSVAHNITLTPIGAIASLDHISEEPGEEIRISLAGPAVSFLLFVVCPPIAATFPSVAPYAVWAGTMNLSFALFNLVPAYPLDGGRVLRALIAYRRPWLQASKIAITLSTIVAIGAILVGLFGGRFNLVIIGFFLNIVNQQELLRINLAMSVAGANVQMAAQHITHTVNGKLLVAMFAPIARTILAPRFLVVNGAMPARVISREELLSANPVCTIWDVAQPLRFIDPEMDLAEACRELWREPGGILALHGGDPVLVSILTMDGVAELAGTRLPANLAPPAKMMIEIAPFAPVDPNPHSKPSLPC